MTTAILAVLSSVITTPLSTGGEERGAVLEVAALSSDPGSVSVGAKSDGDLRVDEAWISFRDLAFHTVESCTDRIAPAAAGKMAAEFVVGTLVGAPGRVDVSGAHYCAAEIVVRRSAQRLGGASIVVHAHLADGTAVVIQSRMRRTIRLVAADNRGFTIDDGAHLALAVDVAKWLGDLDLGSADVETDHGGRVIRIDGRSNRSLLADFEDAMPSSLGLYDDANGDGSVSDAERTGEHRLATGG